MVVFACITTEGYINPPESSEAKCVFNKNNSACQYAVGIGVLGFLACMAFLLLDVYVSFTSNMAERKYSVLADLGFSGTHVCGFHFFFLSKMYSLLLERVPGRATCFSQGVEDNEQKRC